MKYIFRKIEMKIPETKKECCMIRCKECAYYTEDDNYCMHTVILGEL